MSLMSFFIPPPATSLSLCLSVAVVVCGDDTVLLTPGRMSQRQVKERDKEREKEAGLQTPSREHVASPSTLSPGVSYSHGRIQASFAQTSVQSFFLRLTELIPNLGILTTAKGHSSFMVVMRSFLFQRLMNLFLNIYRTVGL